MGEFKLKEYTEEEYKADMQELIREKGLHEAVEKYCDRINSISSVLDYLKHREIQECLCNILFLIELSDEMIEEVKGLQTYVIGANDTKKVELLEVLEIIHRYHDGGEDEKR